MVLGTLARVSRGACIVVPAESFDAVAVLSAVEAERCTALHGVPTMFIAELSELDGREFDLSTLRTGMMGGAPCPAEVMQAVRTQMNMDQVTIVCGMTETAPVSTQTALNDRSTSTAPSAGCTRTSRSRSSTRRPVSPVRAVRPANSAPAGTG